MNIDEILKKSNIFLLQKKYKDLTKTINFLQNHINNIHYNNFISNIQKNVTLGKLYDITKNINSKYNNYINENLDDKDIDKNYKYLISNVEDEIQLFETLYDYKNLNKYKSKSKPLETLNFELKQIIQEYGCHSIKFLLNFIFHNEYNTFDIETKELIEELDLCVTCLSYDFFEVKKNENFYWRIPEKYNNNDFLELTRELWIKNPLNKNNYLKIILYFKNDPLSIKIKTCQLLNKYLYNKKIEILKEIDINNFEIDNKFVKTFMKHDYFGNIYCMKVKEYCKYINKMYFKQLEIINTTFLNLMKDFISKKNTTKNMYEIILLLLLGNDESIDMAGLLIGLIKEKKNLNHNFYYHILNNLTYYLQIKIKKADQNIKSELDKIKSISNEDIDYKKQLIVNKLIPENVKSLTLEKIEEMKSFNNEYYKQLTFVKTIINFPWPSKLNDNIFKQLKKNKKKSKEYLKNINEKLKKSSYGHNEAKKLLLQIIGKWISNPESQGTCFGLVGPPGVGKTLLAKSVGEALDIPFAQITLGGQNDGELLHGHGYTYSGSQPGLIVKKMVDMGKSRCILYFDELDKATSKHGNINEITSILIHLTDPNMNKTFQDRFFQGVEFPLDKVIMIFSYNDSKLIDPILLDRLKEIKVNPYTINDKIEICKNFIIPEISKNTGFEKNKIKFPEKTLKFIINNYTNEAGVRGIKRIIEDMYLQLNLEKINSEGLFKKQKKIINITNNEIKKIITNDIIEPELIHKKPEIGIINGLYATTNGNGGIIPIQIFNNYSPNTEKFDIKLTGNQGDVMKESVQCSLTTALNYIQNNLKKYKIKDFNKYLNENVQCGFHVHAPSTSTPKDGPSAGCAFTSAFISRILNKKIKNDIGMTGEIELTGKITKIGGLMFKLIGAKLAGVKKVFVPLENKKDLDDIKNKNSKLIDKNFTVSTCENISEIIDEILIN
jgi:endopeptidase La